MDPDLAALERAVRAEPGDAALKTRLAHAYAQAGQVAEAYLTWLDLGQEPPAAVTEAAFVEQEDTLRGLAGGWGEMAHSKDEDGNWSWAVAESFLRERRPALALDLRRGLSWGAEDALAEAVAVRTLTWLILPCDEVDPPLDALTSLPGLRSLRLQGERLNDVMLEPLSRIKGLKELTLEGPLLKNEWPRWLQHTHLHRLNCSSPIGDKGLEHLAAISSLGWLSISKAEGASDDGYAHLANLSNLETLWLMLPEAIQGSFLRRFRGHPSVTWLDLRGGNLELRELHAVAEMPQLRTLSLPIADNDLFVSLAGTQLESLSIMSGLTLDDDGLATLGKCTSLSMLELGWSSGVTGRGFTAWREGLRSISGSAGFDDEGARALACLDSLEHVYLEHAERLTDEGLAALARLPRLRALTITGEVTDLGLRALHGHPALERLTIREGITGPYLTDGALDAVVATVPGLGVFRQGFY